MKILIEDMQATFIVMGYHSQRCKWVPVRVFLSKENALHFIEELKYSCKEYTNYDVEDIEIDIYGMDECDYQ